MKILKIECKAKESSILEELLALYDIEGMEIENPKDLEEMKNIWHKDQYDFKDMGENSLIKVYAELDEIKKIIRKHKDKFHLFEVIDYIAEDWSIKWREYFKKIKTDRFIIRAPWMEKEENEIIINPAQAFGTGSHETTINSIKALEKYVKKGDFIYDVGSGSGILAIASLKLGAKKVVATEIDSEAIKNLKENLLLNNIENVEIHNSDLLKEMKEKADIIVSNILPHILKEIKQDAYNLLKADGTLILSGIIDKELNNTIEHFNNFNPVEKIRLNDWNAVIFKKR